MEFKVLNIKSLINAEAQHYPFSWFKLNNIINHNYVPMLISSFPREDFTHINKNTSKKSYNMEFRYLNNEFDEIYKSKQSLFYELKQELTSQVYRKYLSDRVNMSLEKSKVELCLWSYKSTSFLSLHRDKKQKVLTQIIYLNDSWSSCWGGNLCLHDGPYENRIVKKLNPIIGTSIVIINSKKSWHSVEPLNHSAPHCRNSLQVVYWRDN